MPRSTKVFKKRNPTCVGNRKVAFVHQKNNNVSAGGDSDSLEDCSSPRLTSNPCPTVNPPKRESGSKRKISDNLTHYQEYLGSGDIYDIVNLEIIQDLLGKFAACLYSSKHRKGSNLLCHNEHA